MTETMLDKGWELSDEEKQEYINLRYTLVLDNIDHNLLFQVMSNNLSDDDFNQIQCLASKSNVLLCKSNAKALEEVNKNIEYSISTLNDRPLITDDKFKHVATLKSNTSYITSVLFEKEITISEILNNEFPGNKRNKDSLRADVIAKEVTDNGDIIIIFEMRNSKKGYEDNKEIRYVAAAIERDRLDENNYNYKHNKYILITFHNITPDIYKDTSGIILVPLGRSDVNLKHRLNEKNKLMDLIIDKSEINDYNYLNKSVDELIATVSSHPSFDTITVIEVLLDRVDEYKHLLTEEQYYLFKVLTAPNHEERLKYAKSEKLYKL